MPDSDMLEKRNKSLFILLVALVVTTSGVFWFGTKPEQTPVDKEIFKHFDLANIDEIRLTSPADTVVLKYSGSRWFVNELFPADRSMIDVLFATLQQAEPRRPVAASLRDSLATGLQQRGVKVELFTSGEIQQTFFAGGSQTRNQAYFLDAVSGLSYLMTIPGYRVYVAGIFELDESGWRDKFVFGFNWRNFQRLKLNYSRNSSDDFEVAMGNNYFSVLGIVKVDTTKVNDFLDHVSLLTVMDYVPADRTLDSLGGEMPQATILVEDVARNEYRLELYRPTAASRTYHGRINGKQWATFEKSGIEEIVRPRSFFAE